MTAFPNSGRPYGSSEDLGGNAPRRAQFASGANGTGDIAGNSALNADSARFNALVPRQVGLHSVLQTAMPSMNAMSATDYERVLPGGYVLPTQNGSSPASYEKSIFMNLQGDDEI